MLQYVLQQLYSTCVWSIEIPPNNVFHAFAGSDLFQNTLYWKRSNHASVVLVGFVFDFEITCILHVAASDRSVIELWVVGTGATLSKEKVLSITFSSIATVFGVGDISLNDQASLAVVPLVVHLQCLLILLFAWTVCQQIRAFQHRIAERAGQFSRPFDSSIPGTSRVLRPFACVGRPSGAEMDCKNFVPGAFLSCHLV